MKFIYIVDMSGDVVYININSIAFFVNGADTINDINYTRTIIKLVDGTHFYSFEKVDDLYNRIIHGDIK